MAGGGYYLSVRLAGTAIICILAAFGAAFLVARAVNHETPARAATPVVKTTPVAAVATHKAVVHKVDVELVSQFSPLKASLKPRPKPHRKHKPRPKPAVSVAPPSSAVTAAATTPTPVTPAPTFIEPAPSSSTPAPTHSSSSSSSTHHKKSGGSSGGSGTTTIGG
jgi:outer membrane biosynthesis protein TonB